MGNLSIGSATRSELARTLQPSGGGRPARWLLGLRQHLKLRNRPLDRAARCEPKLASVVLERERFASHEPVGCAAATYGDLDQPVEEGQAKAQGLDGGRKAGSETELMLVVAHAAQAGHNGSPRTGQRAHMPPVAHVVLEVFKVHQRRLAEVVVSQLE